ncbi:MAG: hypothetical protein L0207_01340 [Chlamydiae bacterium]|nr:hypothetical protein [Chlamydiota bacterium]
MNRLHEQELALHVKDYRNMNLSIFFILFVILSTTLFGGKKISSCKPPTSKQEKWLFSQIDSESQKLYLSLPCEGKKLVMRLAKESCIEDKNIAVHLVVKRIAQKKAENRNYVTSQ